MTKNPSSNHVALITGAARRIGAEIARTLHQAGMNVALHYNASDEDAHKLCDELNQLRKHSAISVAADLLETESEKALIEQVVTVWNRLDVLVNNASRFYKTPFVNATEYAWEDLINSNMRAPFFLSQAAAPYLAANNGSIVNITDIHAERPLRDYSIYCLSKSGLLMMTKVLAKELGPKIRVNAVAPGAIMWPEGENALSEKEKQQIINQTLLRREGEASDIAKAVLYLTQNGEYVTGQVINVDGGRILCG